MKKLFVFLTIFLMMMISCVKDEDQVVEEEILTPVFQMDIDDKTWKAGDFYYKLDSGNPKIFGSDNVYTIHWLFEVNPKVKSYVIGHSENELVSSFYIYKEGKFFTFEIVSGSLIINKFDTSSKVLSGTFDFKAKLDNKDVNVTNGKFVIKNF